MFWRDWKINFETKTTMLNALRYSEIYAHLNS